MASILVDFFRNNTPKMTVYSLLNLMVTATVLKSWTSSSLIALWCRIFIVISEMALLLVAFDAEEEEAMEWEVSLDTPTMFYDRDFSLFTFFSFENMH